MTDIRKLDTIVNKTKAKEEVQICYMKSWEIEQELKEEGREEGIEIGRAEERENTEKAQARVRELEMLVRELEMRMRELEEKVAGMV